MVRVYRWSVVEDRSRVCGFSQPVPDFRARLDWLDYVNEPN